MWSSIEAKLLGFSAEEVTGSAGELKQLALRNLKTTSDVAGAAIRLALIIGILVFLKTSILAGDLRLPEKITICIALVFFMSLAVSLACRLFIVIFFFFFGGLAAFDAQVSQRQNISDLPPQARKLVKVMGAFGAVVGRSVGFIMIILALLFTTYLTFALANLSQNFFL